MFQGWRVCLASRLCRIRFPSAPHLVLLEIIRILRFMKYLLTPTKTTKGKLINIGVAFLLCIIWVFFIEHLLGIIDTRFLFALPPSNLQVFFYSCIMAPLWEEVTFRYAPLEISRKFNHELLIPIIVIASAIFGWGHGHTIDHILIQGVMGVIFSVLYIKNGHSLSSSIILHSLWNTFVIFIL